MKSKDFNKLIKEKEPNKIIADYMTCKIYLTDKQLQKVCLLGNHHGGCSFGKIKK